MKKKTVANIIMIAIIAVIVITGIGIAGNILGWFDRQDSETATLANIGGTVHIHRDGVAYTAEKPIVLRQGDVLSCDAGGSATICVGNTTLTIGEKANLTILNPSSDGFSAEITQGEIFANCINPVALVLDSRSIQLSQAVVHISVRKNSQTISLFAGSIDQTQSGQKLEYINGEASVGSIQINELNAFVITQLRVVNKSQSTCFSDAQLDALASERNKELQDLINSQLPSDPDDATSGDPTGTTGNTEPQHTHIYDTDVVSATCTTGGYTQYTCTCGDSYSDKQTPAKGHPWTDWITAKEPTSSEEGIQKRTCAQCDAFEEKAIAKIPAGHTHSYSKKTVAATCTTGGYTLHTCSCGVNYKDNETAALGHKYTEKVTKVTCTINGYTEHICSCGDSYTDSVVKAAGHTWGQWETVKKPTTSQTGSQKRTCSTCKEKEEQSLPKLEIAAAGYVYVTIRCDTILNNMDKLKPGKAEFVPGDGVILPQMKVAYAEGETVFDILVRVCDTANIQLEYSWEPLYDAYYIEGIHNLYEFDCGGESGWMYKVNGWFPNYGVSAYTVKDGDSIAFLYSCHGLGTDVGAPEWIG